VLEPVDVVYSPRRTPRPINQNDLLRLGFIDDFDRMRREDDLLA
jgi:hypothetical protein